MRYRVSKCPCGHRACTNYFVDPVARYQGVSFTERQAHAVADLLNQMEGTAGLSVVVKIDYTKKGASDGA